MQKLKPCHNTYLTETILKNLFQNRIISVLDFLEEDNDKLVTLTKLNLQEILSIKSDILKRNAAPIENGATLFLRKMLDKKFLGTGISGLDDILNGGIPIGSLTEFCGLADCGKSQICAQIAINCVKDYHFSVLYVDTKGDFSAVRIQKILAALKLTHKDMALVMYKIKIVYVWTMNELIDLLKSIKNKQIEIENLGLIIIDSLPCLMFQHLGDNNKVGLSFLNTFVNYCRFLSKQMNLGIICVNIQTRWIEQDSSELDDESDLSMNELKDNSSVEKRNRCLGLYWQHVPSLVLLLEKGLVIETHTEIKVSLQTSFSINRTCILHISSLGVT